MDAIKSSLTAFLLDPRNQPILSIIKGFRNGLVYGAKIRFPHALVMIFLFRSGTFREKISLILTATKQHAMNLGLFVMIYKSTVYLLDKSARKKDGIHTFIAGLLGGYYVFGRENTNVNQQIVLYVFARVVLGLAKLSSENQNSKGKVVRVGGVVERNAWGAFAAVSWGLVMWLFREYPDCLQSSLRSSMDYLYVDSDSWDSWRNFLLYNV